MTVLGDYHGLPGLYVAGVFAAALRSDAKSIISSFHTQYFSHSFPAPAPCRLPSTRSQLSCSKTSSDRSTVSSRRKTRMESATKLQRDCRRPCVREIDQRNVSRRRVTRGYLSLQRSSSVSSRSRFRTSRLSSATSSCRSRPRSGEWQERPSSASSCSRYSSLSRTK